ncbi:MAG TPA: phage minor head protein [Gaiellaceae bacterium]|nr:phage minor head protein [Gaiellaceae bacterium]
MSTKPTTKVRRHNAVLRAAEKRAQELEPKLAKLLAPILSGAGLTAARGFRAAVTDHVTASGEPTPWSPPAADEVLDVDALVANLRKKTDPVRRAMIETVMTATLDGAGIDFEVTNPFAGRVLAQSGAHVRNIAETTQLNVMRIVKASYEQGLSIADTAKAIRSGMAAAAAEERAVTIARSELAAAVNGGALAATQIVASATGTTYSKQWVSTPDERTRESHSAANGQVVGLNDYFDVGGAALQHPGDPDGPPDETVSCRCTCTFQEGP